jgi:predicted GNAT family acetyltransferase
MRINQTLFQEANKMKKEKDDIILNFNQELKQFEVKINNEVARIEYHIMDERIFLTHTEVPEELSGQGIGSLLAQKTLDHIEKMNLKVVPYCNFIADYIRKNPKYRPLLATGINIV